MQGIVSWQCYIKSPANYVSSVMTLRLGYAGGSGPVSHGSVTLYQESPARYRWEIAWVGGSGGPLVATCQNIAHGYTGDTLTKRSLAWRTCADYVRLVGMPICFLFDLAWYRNDEPRRSKRFKAQ